MTNQWKAFFASYRNRVATTEADLFTQVGRTINGAPISKEEFACGIRNIVDRLKLRKEDVLFEFCCGNGLLSLELASRVSHVIATDFTEHLIAAARQHRSAANIEYHAADALRPIDQFTKAIRPTKYLMGFSLGYFDPAGLRTIIEHILEVSPRGSFLFFLTGIPDAERKWDFHDTPERRARALENERAGGIINDGMGRWWHKVEIVEVARALGLSADVQPEPPGLTNYRMDALIS